MMEKENPPENRHTFSSGDSQRSLSKILATVLAIGLGLTIGAILILILREESKEKFSTDGFATAVQAQNPKVFEKLAEM